MTSTWFTFSTPTSNWYFTAWPPTWWYRSRARRRWSSPASATRSPATWHPDCYVDRCAQAARAAVTGMAFEW